MSKIDLSKAKIGDKFRTRNGEVLTYKGTDGRIVKSRSDYYVCVRSDDYKITYFNDGAFILYEKHPYDLVEQVFDKGDLLDNNISVEERRQAIVEMAKSEYEKAKELGVAIQNLPHIVEQPKEDDPELQRRQEVVELAEKVWLFKDSEGSYYAAFHDAEIFVKLKTKYLKEGEL